MSCKIEFRSSSLSTVHFAVSHIDSMNPLPKEKIRVPGLYCHVIRGELRISEENIASIFSFEEEAKKTPAEGDKLSITMKPYHPEHRNCSWSP
jgi:hypothetical protein